MLQGLPSFYRSFEHSGLPSQARCCCHGAAAYTFSTPTNKNPSRPFPFRPSLTPLLELLLRITPLLDLRVVL